MSQSTLQRKNWDVRDALIILAGVLLSREGVGLLARSINPGANRAGVFFAEITVAALVLFLLHFYFIEHRYMGTGRLEYRSEKWLWYVQIGIMTGGLCFGLLTAGYGLVLRTVGFGVAPLFSELIMTADQPLERVLLGISLVGLFPVVVETIFRGFLHEALKKEMGATGALLTGAVLFGLLLAEPLLIPAYVLGSMALGFVYELTGSLYTSMVALGVWQGLILGWIWILGV